MIRFKAEASAWTPAAVQLQQVWTDPPARRQGFAGRALRDLIRLLLAGTPTVCLFVRAENAPAIRLYESVGMHHVLDYRSRACLLKTLILARHAHAVSNVGDAVNAVPPGQGLSAAGRRGGARTRPRARVRADRARSQLAPPSGARHADPRARRPRARPASSSRGSTRSASARSRAAPLADYRAWAWANEAGADCPGGGESRADAAARLADGARGIAGAARARSCSPSATGCPSGTCSMPPTGRAPSQHLEPVPHATALPARAGGRRAGRRDAAGRGRPRRSLRMPRLVDDGTDVAPPMHTSSMTVLRPRALLAALVALLAVAAAGCGGSTVAVPELTSLTSVAPAELRRGFGEVRPEGRADDARHRQGAVARRRRRLRHACAACPR